MKRRAVPFLALCLLTFACSLPAADPVYVGVGYGLFKSTDAGATWNMLNLPLNSPFLKGLFTPHFGHGSSEPFEDLHHRIGNGHGVLRQPGCRRHLDRHALYRHAADPFGCGLRGPGDLHLGDRYTQRH